MRSIQLRSWSIYCVSSHFPLWVCLSVFRFLCLLCSFLDFFTIIVILSSALLARSGGDVEHCCFLVLLLELLFHHFLLPSTCIKGSSSVLGWADVSRLTTRLLFLSFFLVITCIIYLASAVSNSSKALVEAWCWSTLSIAIVSINLLELWA